MAWESHRAFFAVKLMLVLLIINSIHHNMETFFIYFCCNSKLLFLFHNQFIFKSQKIEKPKGSLYCRFLYDWVYTILAYGTLSNIKKNQMNSQLFSQIEYLFNLILKRIVHCIKLCVLSSILWLCYLINIQCAKCIFKLLNCLVHLNSISLYLSSFASSVCS